MRCRLSFRLGGRGGGGAALLASAAHYYEVDDLADGAVDTFTARNSAQVATIGSTTGVDVRDPVIADGVATFGGSRYFIVPQAFAPELGTWTIAAAMSMPVGASAGTTALWANKTGTTGQGIYFAEIIGAGPTRTLRAHIGDGTNNAQVSYTHNVFDTFTLVYLTCDGTSVTLGVAGVGESSPVALTGFGDITPAVASYWGARGTGSGGLHPGATKALIRSDSAWTAAEAALIAGALDL